MRNDFNHPFTNKIINGLYPPGSVIKMGISLSFLENGISDKLQFNVVVLYQLEIEILGVGKQQVMAYWI